MKYAYLGSYQIHSNTYNPNGIYLSPPVEGLAFPELRLSNYNKPGEHGAFVSNNFYGGRRILLQGSIFGSSSVIYEAARREFIHQLAIIKSTSNVIQPTVLKLKTMDDLEVQVNVYLKEYKMDVDNILGTRFFLDLYAPDFYIESQSESLSSITTSTPGGAIYPVIYPVVYDASAGGTEIIVNNGTSEAYPTVTINGPVIDPIIENLTLNKYIELDQTLVAGESVTIDMKNRTIMKGTQSIIGTETSASDFWWLAPGSNIVKFLTGNASDTGDVSVSYRDSYLGI